MHYRSQVQQFTPNFVAQQTGVPPHQYYQGTDRPIYYPQMQAATIYTNFTQPPPNHQPYPHNSTPFVAQNAIDSVAEQLKSHTQQSMQQMGNTMQQMPSSMILQNQVHYPNSQMPYYPRQNHNPNSLSRGQTPASHSDSKRSSPQTSQPSDNSTQQQIVDYTPPGTPQNLTPITDDQSQQYIATMAHVGDKDVDSLSNKFSESNLSDRNHVSMKIFNVYY